MPEKKKQREKPAQVPRASKLVSPSPSPNDEAAGTGNEPWRKWKVKPTIEWMVTDPPEVGIGKRIAYCRGQLDNLGVDALSRYTRYFDKEGISRMSIFRYEDGALPGARELRILCVALWVPAGWLLFGHVEERRADDDVLLDTWLRKKLIRMQVLNMPEAFDELDARAEPDETTRRQKWIDEARKPALKS